MPTYAKAEGSLVGRKWVKLGAGRQGKPEGSRYPRLEAERVPPPSSLPFQPPSLPPLPPVTPNANRFGQALGNALRDNL